MSKKKDILIIYIFIVLEILILFNSKSVIDSVINSSKLFILNVFPGLFPTMVIGKILVSCNVYKILPKFIRKIFNKLFNFDDITTSIYIMSMLCGMPSNAIFINDYLERNILTKDEASSLLKITHFINPLFVIGTVGINVLNSFKIGLILLLGMYLVSIIKAVLYRNTFKKHTVHIKENSNDITIVSDSIMQSIKSLLLIFGIIILFNILVTLLCSIFKLNLLFKTIINGILEITGGILYIKLLNIKYVYKVLLSFCFIMFGGICLKLQTISMIKKDRTS